MNQSKRQTGRTTRMLEDAMKLSKEGKAVYVIAPHRKYAELLKRQLIEMTGTKLHGIKVEIPEDVRNMNWKTMKLERAHPNCEVLVDHYTIETLFAPLIEMHTRYDSPANAAGEATASKKGTNL